MVDLAKGYISQAIFYSAHTLDNRVRYRQEEAEATFGPLFNVQSQQTNVPDDFDPGAPRLMFQSSHKQLLLSKNSAQFVLGFENAEKSIANQVEIVIDNIKKVTKRLSSFSSCTGEVGFILTFNFPSSASRSRLSGAVFEKFLKLPSSHEVASASVKVGYETADSLFLNFEADVYELRRGGFQFNAFTEQAFDVSKLELQETGYSFKVDINNKPKIGTSMDYTGEANNLIEAMRGFMRDSFDEFVRF
ncbi:hypothetical protein [Pseudomonas viridiflava]|uniref:hypothetical protein n=1 Tax=Pseudomonas viridiflava TaxID=33069 RepID=UPI000F015860|nr:hypothetical protein [Pseudomonas viridiflava]